MLILQTCRNTAAARRPPLPFELAPRHEPNRAAQHYSYAIGRDSRARYQSRIGRCPPPTEPTAAGGTNGLDFRAVFDGYGLLPDQVVVAGTGRGPPAEAGIRPQRLSPTNLRPIVISVVGSRVGATTGRDDAFPRPSGLAIIEKTGRAGPSPEQAPIA
jgi:hypothetical protein